MKTTRAIDKLVLQSYSPNTINTYSSCLKEFEIHFQPKGLLRLSKEEITSYILGIAKKGYSRSTLNQHINAIKFYYEKVLDRDRCYYDIDRPRKEFLLPVVLSKEEVGKLFNNITNLKHRAMASLLYSAGLRVGELINLKIKDIDSARMQIKIEKGKGSKDRYVPLDNKVLKLLRKYYRTYLPETYLFNGVSSNKYSPTSVRCVLKNAVKRSNIVKKVTPHTLRHSYATHLLESGTDLRYIQCLLGHNSVKTTEIYTHVRSIKLNEIKSPFNDLSLDW